MKPTLRLLRLAVVCCLGATSVSARADYGFIPDYKKLVARLGVDIFKTSENYGSDGFLTDVTISGTPVTLTDTKFWLDAEYGIAQDWSAYLYTGFSNSSVDSQASGNNALIGNGVADTTLALRWNFKNSDPILTADAYVKIPISSTNVANGEVVVTDGAFDVGLKLHSGHRSGILVLSLSPGFVFRSNGYSAALTGDAAIGLDFTKGYVRAFSYVLYSLEETKLRDSSLAVHDTPGSGNSYARLSGSPIGFFAGGRVGFRLFNEFVVEAQGTKAIIGTRYPNFFALSFNIGYTFDFFRPINAKKVKDVPFDEEQDDFYKNR